MHSTETRSGPFSFKCVRCGICCRENGFVYFLRDDIRRAAGFLGQTVSAFTKKYLIKTSGGWAVTVTSRKPCIFLSESGCVINDAKPKQCGTFPYWKEYVGPDGMLKDFDRPCPGVTTKAVLPKKKK